MEQSAKVGEGLTDGELHEQTEKGTIVITHLQSINCCGLITNHDHDHRQLVMVTITVMHLVVWGMNPTRLPSNKIGQKVQIFIN